MTPQRRFVVMPIIVVLYALFLHMDSFTSTWTTGIGFLVFASLITVWLLRWVELGSTTSFTDRRQRKLNKMLKSMNEDDLDFLRERLSDQTPDDGEYESLEQLLQEKQKRSM